MISQVDMETVKAALPKTLRWTRFDFMRAPSGFIMADRAEVIKQLTTPMPEENDLRFIHDNLVVFCHILPWDSAFFGYKIARLDGIYPLDSDVDELHIDYAPALERLCDIARERGVQYILTNTYPEELAYLRGLAAKQFTLISSMGFYYMPLATFSYPERFAVRIATADDVPYIAAAARDEINPFDRFHADPFITRPQADRMMTSWVENSVLQGFADYTFVPDDPEPEAFVTTKDHQWMLGEQSVTMNQLVLSAVKRRFKGWMLKLFVEAAYHAQNRGVDYLFVSTQLTTRAAIKHYERLQFRFGRVEHVFRRVL